MVAGGVRGSGHSIALLNQYAGSPSLGMEFRPHWMSAQWLRSGHDVAVVAGSYSHLRRVNPTVRRATQAQTVEGVPFIWVRTNRYSGNGAGRLATMLEFAGALRFGVERHVPEDASIVVASSTHPFDIRPAHALARKRGALLVYEIHDLWPLSPMLLGGHSPRHPLMRWMQREEDFACKEADLVVSILPATLPYLTTRGLDEDRWVCVPNGVDVEPAREAIPAPVSTQLEELRRRYSVLVGYAGAIGLANRVEALVDAATFLEAQGVGVVVVGDGPARDDIVRRAAERANVLVLPPVPGPQARTIIDGLDIAYIGLANSPLFEFGISPNKLFDYMSAAKPVVCAISSSSNPVVASGCGVMVPSGAPEEIAGAIGGLAALDAGARSSMGALGRAYVETHHRQDRLAADFLVAVDRTLGSVHAA